MKLPPEKLAKQKAEAPQGTANTACPACGQAWADHELTELEHCKGILGGNRRG